MKMGWLFLLLSTFVEVIADCLFKQWSIDGQKWRYLLGMLLYVGGVGLWASSLKFIELSKGMGIFTVMNCLVVVLCGTLIFGEHLTPMCKIGIATGVLSLIFMQF